MPRSLTSILYLAASAATAETQFHHLHLNSTDPASSVSFYAARFDCERLPFAGSEPAIFAQKSWLLFNKVAAPPPHEITSAIWHFGWGAEDMRVEVQRQTGLGTKFHTPITELFPNFFYAYVEGPDNALIEINTARHHRFGHLHLLSADPLAAGEWYIRQFGARRVGGTSDPVKWSGVQVGPYVSLMMDNVNLIIFPAVYARQAWPALWKDRASFDSPRGRVVDHIAFRVDNLAAALEGPRVLAGPAPIPGTSVRSAYVEGPDNIVIELVESSGR